MTDGVQALIAIAIIIGSITVASLYSSRLAERIGMGRALGFSSRVWIWATIVSFGVAASLAVQGGLVALALVFLLLGCLYAYLVYRAAAEGRG